MNASYRQTGFISTILNAKPAAVLGLIVVILVWVMASSIPKEMRKNSREVRANRVLLISICELLAKDLPLIERRQYCVDPYTEEGTDYLEFFTGTIGGFADKI